MGKDRIKSLITLHALLLAYSLGGIFSKLAGQAEFLSLKFIVCYGVVLLNLAVYAVVWQQIIKNLPLLTAYPNKAVTVVWGLVWGMLIFKETITVWNIVGAILIILGTIKVVRADG